MNHDAIAQFINSAHAANAAGKHGAALNWCKKALQAAPDIPEAWFNLGLANQGLGKQRDAIDAFLRAATLTSNNPDGQNSIGLQLTGLGALADAERCLKRALALAPGFAFAHSNLGKLLELQGQHAEAEKCFRKAISLQPDLAALHANLSGILNLQKKHAAAAVAAQRAIELAPQIFEGWSNLGSALAGQRNYEAAEAAAQKALTIAPRSFEAWNNLSAALSGKRQFVEAEDAARKAIAYAPKCADAWGNLCTALCGQEMFAAAEEAARKALAFLPDSAILWNSLSASLAGQKRFELAATAARTASERETGNSTAWNNLCAAMCGLRRYEEAEQAARNAIELAPDEFMGWNSLGITLLHLKRHDEVLKAASRAVQLAPQVPEPWHLLGTAQLALQQVAEAEASLRRATILGPHASGAWNLLAFVLGKLDQHTEAANCLAKALALKPDAKDLLGSMLHLRLRIHDWNKLADDTARCLKAVDSGLDNIDPFPLLAFSEDAALQRRVAERFTAESYPPQKYTFSRPPTNASEKIRIGYFSADFHEHPVSYLAAGMFELHDRERFEVFAFSFEPDRGDDMRRRVAAAFDHFIDVCARPDREIAERAHALGIDIAINLGGHTSNARTDVFAWRAAPIQVSYLGYAGTMGAPYIDYIIADRVVIPPESRRHYTEQVVWLPNSYMVSDSKRPIAERQFTREELGLPASGFVFCCFNNSYKITPETFDRWMRILAQVEGSVLWLSGSSPDAMTNLRKEAAQRKIDPDRLLFAGKIPLMAEHLARLRAADLFLDTLPYNAHTTACDALWAGVPVLTLSGRSFASRVAASLLNAAGLPELIAASAEEYELLAVELATTPDRLSVLRERLARDQHRCALFDTERFTRDLESAYDEMMQLHRTGQAPRHIG